MEFKEQTTIELGTDQSAIVFSLDGVELYIPPDLGNGEDDEVPPHITLSAAIATACSTGSDESAEHIVAIYNLFVERVGVLL